MDFLDFLPFLLIRLWMSFGILSTGGKGLGAVADLTSGARRGFHPIYGGFWVLSTVSTPPTTITISLIY